MALADPESYPPSSRTSSVTAVGQSSWPCPETPPRVVQDSNSMGPETISDHADLTTELEKLAVGDKGGWNELEQLEALGVDLELEAGSDLALDTHAEFTIDDLAHRVDLEKEDAVNLVKARGPFHKWMKSLHRRASQRPKLGADGHLPWHLLDSQDRAILSRGVRHKKSWSGSSFEFVSRVKSASISLASVSGAGRSRRNTRHSRAGSKTDRSSKGSVAGPRLSEDSWPSHAEAAVQVDPLATERALQRRQILEELIATEEGYIGDLRFLMNVYVTLLASLPTLPVGLRSSINQNLTEIVELHEEILGELHRVVPNSEYTQIDFPKHTASTGPRGHNRWRSLDSVPENDDRMSRLHQVPGMIADPQVAEEVAKVFGKKMNRFFIYKEYGAKYEMMIKDVASASRSMPQWETYHRGLEALASSLGSVNSQADQSRKSLTIQDLLVKPVQRVCKYPLLFAELLKFTPVNDCPNSHMEVENALIRLREATAEINRATDDVRMKSTLERTWMLQDRLAFANQRLDAASKNRIRSFGHVQLCGTLHVCWSTKDDVGGRYMICLLYRDVVCLASPAKVEQVYTIQACINLSGVTVEEVDNGRGLQCHTAPFSWKLVFECDFQMYEIIMTACSPREEMEWRTRLVNASAKDGTQERSDATLYSSISLGIKSLGSLYGRPGTVARRYSIQRATTMGPRPNISQVILKNTCVIKDALQSGSSSIKRSQSFATSHRIAVLAPPRAERSRIEALLSDVWSREELPLPGMTARSRSEHLVRSSASSVMKKLSAVSITSSFTKRSGSFASAKQALADKETVEGEDSDSEEHGLVMSGPAKDKNDGAIRPASIPSGVDSEHASSIKLSVVGDGQDGGTAIIKSDKECNREDECDEIDGETARSQNPQLQPTTDTSQIPTTLTTATSVEVGVPPHQCGLVPGGELKRERSLPPEKPRTQARSGGNKWLTPSKISHPSEKEDYSVEKSPARLGIVRRASKKWKVPKTIVLNKSVVTQGIRSIFK